MTTPDAAIMKAVYERRSVRHFADAQVSRDLVMAALKAASRAPSGLNNQPPEDLKLPDRLELMAVVTVGASCSPLNQKSHRRPIEEVILLGK
jgi:nitroreductase